MTKQKSMKSSVLGALTLFVTVAALFTVAILAFDAVDTASGGNKVAIAVTMLCVIAALAALCTVVDFFRRKYTVDKPVKKILDATDKIAKGDFSVKLDIRHIVNRFDEYDCIMENINKMAVELSRTEMLHADFISNVSHELKTPLAVIQNYAALLQNKDIDENMRVEYSRTLANASKKLTALVTDILKLNKLENQEIKSDPEKFDLTENLAEVVLGFEESIESKGLELDCDLDEQVFVYSLPSYLEIVWNNLISNAVKFTERGGKIGISLKKHDGYAEITVADTGCGISAETGKHIFEKFYQGDTSHSQDGNGLGLALVKKVIDIIGGEINVESEVGKGTKFSVMLKIRQ